MGKIKSINSILLILVFYFISCVDPNSLPSGKLTSGIWYCDSQLSDLYAANNISVTTRLKFSGEGGKGSVEIYEGSGLSKSCITNGQYNLVDGRKSLIISGISNSNCPWMNKLNGSYFLIITERQIIFQKDQLTISTSK